MEKQHTFPNLKPFLNDSLIKKEITMEMRKYLELNGNENISYWDTAIRISRRKFVALNVYITKHEG